MTASNPDRDPLFHAEAALKILAPAAKHPGPLNNAHSRLEKSIRLMKEEREANA